VARLAGLDRAVSADRQRGGDVGGELDLLRGESARQRGAARVDARLQEGLAGAVLAAVFPLRDDRREPLLPLDARTEAWAPARDRHLPGPDVDRVDARGPAGHERAPDPVAPGG